MSVSVPAPLFVSVSVCACVRFVRVCVCVSYQCLLPCLCPHLCVRLRVYFCPILDALFCFTLFSTSLFAAGNTLTRPEEFNLNAALPKLNSIRVSPTDKNFCVGKKDGNYEDINSCTNFISCSGGQQYFMECPTNGPGPGRLFFSQPLSACTYPDYSNCVQRA